MNEYIKQIINTNKIDPKTQPMFFGEQMGFQRYDNPKYKQIEKMYDIQFAQFWNPKEINLTKDRIDFETLSEQEKFIFTKNLGYQILLDSIQSRGVIHLLEHCSNLEVESFIEEWAYFEGIHSRSYTHIIKNVYPNPSKVFDEIGSDTEILKRATSVTKYYDDLINNIGDETEYDRKKKLYLTLVSIQILEYVRFYVSFACSYYFAERNKMIGNSLIIKLIQRDENCFSDDTEILTENGWVLFKDLNIDDTKVAQFNEGKIEFVKALRYINKPYKGEMINIYNKYNNCLVTPDHDILLYNDVNGYHKISANDVKFNHTKSVPNHGFVDNGGASNLGKLDRLKIALQADGSNLNWCDANGVIHRRGKNNGFSHSINISKERKIKRLDSILDEFGDEIKFKKSFRKNSNKICYKISLPNYNCKTLDFLYDLDLNRETCIDIIDEVVKWDGSIRKDTKTFLYCSTDKKCIDVIQDIAIRAGYTTYIIKSDDKRKESYKKYYRLSIIRKGYTGSQSFSKKRVYYDGNVYCVTVPSGNVITRLNDKTMIAGNCHGGFTKFVIKQLNTREDEGFVQVAKDCRELVQKMWKDAGDEEMEWAKYLFKDGDLMGLNSDILSQYMKYLVNLRMKVCGFDPVYPKTKNPITWVNKYIDSTNVQIAPQETEITSYLTNAMDGTMNDEDIIEF